MNSLIVLFNLKEGVDAGVYESWAKSTDLPIVRGLSSVDRFDVYRCEGIFGSAADAPYQYVEHIDIADLEKFGDEVADEQMRKVAGEFQTFADHPVFMLAQKFS